MPKYTSQRLQSLGPSRLPRGRTCAANHALRLSPTPHAHPIDSGQRLSILAKLFHTQSSAFTGGGEVSDPHEQEADQTAAELTKNQPGPLPRPVQAARPGAGLKGVHPTIQRAISAAAGQGERLPQTLSSRFGQKLGADLSSVRVHTDGQADALNQALNARAFTSGRDVFFRQGQYSPHTPSGQSLLAHELTHVAQQTAGPSTTQRAVQPMVQRYIMQIGKDDSYTTGMVEKLQQQHSKETYLQFGTLRDSGGKPYRPKKFSKDLGLHTDQKLAKLALDEPVRIVGHGNIYGKIGGYSGEAMAHLLVELGLPLEHTGGIDVHGCLPASSYTENKQKKQPHIVELQDKLAEVDIHEVVRGYEHCIFPSNMNEVPSEAYHLYSDVAMVAFSDRDGKWQLDDDQLKIMKETMGDKECSSFLAENTSDGKKPKGNGLQFYFKLRDWMESKGLFLKAKLRRADSVRDNSI